MLLLLSCYHHASRQHVNCCLWHLIREEALETPIGYIPKPGSLDVSGLNISSQVVAKLFEVDKAQWKDEVRLTRADKKKEPHPIIPPHHHHQRISSLPQRRPPSISSLFVSLSLSHTHTGSRDEAVHCPVWGQAAQGHHWWDGRPWRAPFFLNLEVMFFAFGPTWNSPQQHNFPGNKKILHLIPIWWNNFIFFHLPSINGKVETGREARWPCDTHTGGVLSQMSCLPSLSLSFFTLHCACGQHVATSWLLLPKNVTAVCLHTHAFLFLPFFQGKHCHPGALA